VRRSAMEGRCTLVVDATGLGAPVVDMLRIVDLRCEIVPVIMTGGERESLRTGSARAETRLDYDLQLMLDRRELGFRRGCQQREILGRRSRIWR